MLKIVSDNINDIPENAVDLRNATATEMAEAVKKAVEEAFSVALKPEVTEEQRDEPKKKPKWGRYNFKTGEIINEGY